MTTPSTRTTVTGLRAVAAEGARIGFVSCFTCGVTLTIDPYDAEQGIDVVGIHKRWHEANGDVVHYEITINEEE